MYKINGGAATLYMTHSTG